MQNDLYSKLLKKGWNYVHFNWTKYCRIFSKLYSYQNSNSSSFLLFLQNTWQFMAVKCYSREVFICIASSLKLLSIFPEFHGLPWVVLCDFLVPIFFNNFKDWVNWLSLMTSKNSLCILDINPSWTKGIINIFLKRMTFLLTFKMPYFFRD